MKPKIITLYVCPECEGYMEHLVKDWTNANSEVWTCSKCKKRFILSFQKIGKKRRKS